MDHLIQIPQVDRAWEPIPEPWVTLGLIAGLGTGLSLGTLVTPVTFRPAGITAKAAATLDVLTGGRAFVGIGAGWWEREHAAYGLPFPAAASASTRWRPRSRRCGRCGRRAPRRTTASGSGLPETTSYPRPSGGSRSSSAGAASDGPCGSPPGWPTRSTCRPTSRRLDRKIGVLHAHCREVGRDPAEVAVTVLDLPVVGRDRDDTWARVERLRGRTPAAAFARRTHAGTAAQQRDRYGALADRGVDTVFLGLADLAGPEDVLALRPLLTCSSALVRPRTRRATISCWICWVPSKMSRILESRAHFSSSSVSL